MAILLADHNCEGHLERMIEAWTHDGLLEIWVSMNWEQMTLKDLSLSIQSSDEMIWLVCEKNDAVLLTNNRNDDGNDSLEATIRRLNNEKSFPVLTIGDELRFMSDGAYSLRASRVALDYLIRIDELRGAGRLYIP